MKSIEEITQECTQDNESNISTKETKTISTGVGKETSQHVKPQGGKQQEETPRRNRRKLGIFNRLCNLKTIRYTYRDKLIGLDNMNIST